MKVQNILVLLSDGFGGTGGIAKFSRDLVTVLASRRDVVKIVAVPRVMPLSPVGIPPKVEHVVEGLGGKLRYIIAVLRLLRQSRRYDIVICGHVNLLPLAYFASRWVGAPVILVVYGVEVWKAPAKVSIRWMIRKLDAFISISAVTKERLVSWSRLDDRKGWILPNSFDPGCFSPGPKNAVLLERYRLLGHSVLMTCGRMASTERLKGFDEVLDILPEVRKVIPNLRYLVVGDGDDRARLEGKTRRLGLEDVVIFTGYVREEEKVDHYRLADVYVMPSQQEGFGFVYLEAMACGIPTIAGKWDGGREALRGGALGRLVEPGDKADLVSAILEALSRPKRVPEGLDYFCFENYTRRVNDIFASITDGLMVDDVGEDHA